MTYGWSDSDKRVAKAAIERARRRAEDLLTAEFRSMPMKSFDDLWRLELLLHKWRRDFKSVFEFSHETAESKLADFLTRGWVVENDLKDISEPRLKRITNG